MPAVKILHVLGGVNRGGAESMVMSLYRNLDRSVIQFDFVIHTTDICEYENEIHDLGGVIYRVPKYKVYNHYMYVKLWRKLLCDHTEYKIIHGHYRSTASIYLGIARNYGIVTIAHSHSVSSRGNILERLIKGILQARIKDVSDYLFACSNDAGIWLFGVDATKNENYTVINNSIDTSLYAFSQAKRDLIRESLCLNGHLVIGHVGSFTYPKNHKYLIQTFKSILEKDKNAILLLVGDGPLRTRIEREIEQSKMRNNALLVGIVHNVADYLQAIDVLVFPSLYEGLPVSLIEAQCAGLPIIASDAVTRDVAITDLIEFMPLSISCNTWANRILKCVNEVSRNDHHNEIRRSGYDVKINSSWLQQFYVQAYSTKLHSFDHTNLPETMRADQ